MSDELTRGAIQRELAEEVWQRCARRIPYMHDWQKGTHAQHCINDLVWFAQQIRQETLEEAARAAEAEESRQARPAARPIAQAIRHLKELQ